MFTIPKKDELQNESEVEQKLLWPLLTDKTFGLGFFPADIRRSKPTLIFADLFRVNPRVFNLRGSAGENAFLLDFCPCHLNFFESKVLSL